MVMDAIDADPESEETFEEWVVLLTQQLREPRTVAPEVPLSVALDEVRVWAIDASDVAWSRSDNSKSLKADLDAALTQVGTRAQTYIAAGVDELGALLLSVKSNKERFPEFLSSVEARAKIVLDDLSSEDALRAVWNDAVAASRLGHLEGLASCLSLLGDLLERSGQHARWLFLDMAAAIVGDDRGGVSFRSGTSEMPLSSRLEFAEQLILGYGEVGECVVWLSYADARLNGAADFGPVAFYEVDQEVAQVLHGIESDFPHRTELEQIVKGNPELWVPGAQRKYQVLARVDLGVRSSHGALTAARELVDIFLTGAVFESGGSGWRNCGSQVVLIDGVEAGGSRDDYREGDDIDHFGQNATAEALRYLGPVLGRVLKRRKLPDSLVQAMRLMTEARAPEARSSRFSDCRHIDTRIVIALEDAAFEHVASFAGGETAKLAEAVQA